MPDSAIQEALKGLDGVLWRDTAFADLQWYYAEEGVYVLRCKHGEPNEHLCVVRAKSADEAIARAVFDLHKSDEKKKVAPVGNAAALREAVEGAKKKALYISRHYTTPNSLTGNILELLASLNAALAAPPRNCDVGTAEEQAERYRRYCDKFLRGGMHYEECPCCGKIPFGKCEFTWAQMPYVEQGGGAKCG